MPSYKIFKEDKLLGHTNIASCDCAVFKYLGIDINGNTMLYDPTLHTIKECNTTVLFDPPYYEPTPKPGSWLGSCIDTSCNDGLVCSDLSNNIVTGTKACVTDIYFPTPSPTPPSFWPSSSYLAYYNKVDKSCKLCIDFSDSKCPPDVKTLLPMQECCARTGDKTSSEQGHGCDNLPWVKNPNGGYCFDIGRNECKISIDGMQNYIECKTEPSFCLSR